MPDHYFDITNFQDINELNDDRRMTVYVTFFRLDLYNTGRRFGAHAIREKCHEYKIVPLPSISRINKILQVQCLTHGRTGYYEGE